MPNRHTWVVFLLICFLVTGLAGLFASYAGSIPLERAIFRCRALGQPADCTAVFSEGEREAAAVGNRSRLMLGVVTVLTAGLGAGILLLVTRDSSPSR
jgi:hypothetical protein